MLNTDKSNGNLYVVHKVFANDTEYYTIDAGVKTEDALASVKAAVESFQILGDSTLKEAAPQQAPIENTAQTDANTGDAAAQPAADANTGDAAANGSTDAAATDGTANAAATDNSDSSGTATNSGGFTEEQLTNTDETRTLYRNSDGHPFVITPDGNGNWLILMEMFTTSSMNRMHMMQKATAITGTEKQQTYIICLYSKREA